MQQLITTKELSEAQKMLIKKVTEEILVKMSERGISAYQLAREAEVAQSTVLMIGKGGNLTLKSMAKICWVLGINVFVG